MQAKSVSKECKQAVSELGELICEVEAKCSNCNRTSWTSLSYQATVSVKAKGGEQKDKKGKRRGKERKGKEREGWTEERRAKSKEKMKKDSRTAVSQLSPSQKNNEQERMHHI